METFEIISTDPLLSPYIKHYWILETDYISGIAERTIPTGNIQLVFHRGDRLFSSHQQKLQPRSFLCGQSNYYSDLSCVGKISMIVVVFNPYGARAFFRMPMNEFHKIDVSVKDLNDRELEDLESRIFDEKESKQCIKWLEAFLIKRLFTVNTYNYKRIGSAILKINRESQLNITSLAETACLSYKQFNRIFTEYVGTNPKEFIRVIRFQRALYIMQTRERISFTEVAYMCGYSDQSHFIKEFKSLSGYTPTQYLAVCDPFSDYFTNS